MCMRTAVYFEGRRAGSLDEKAMRHVDEALAVSFGLGSVQG